MNTEAKIVYLDKDSQIKTHYISDGCNFYSFNDLNQIVNHGFLLPKNGATFTGITYQTFIPGHRVLEIVIIENPVCQESIFQPLSNLANAKCNHQFNVDCSVVHIDSEFPGDDGLRQRIFAECLEPGCNLFFESAGIAEILARYFKEHKEERSNA